MTTDTAASDPLEFVRGMWGRMGFSLPGMMTPTLDVNELDKRIGDMRAVEGWLKMNLNMLQMTIQGLDVQRAAIAAVQAMGQVHEKKAAPDAPEADKPNPFLWPWGVMGADGAAKEAAKPPAPCCAGKEAKPAAAKKKAAAGK
ncbi:MAG: hypothetical protein LBR05_00540 [Azoarcus sp.]|jgi:hypothetical protein|nr:hypothetical protein [Azoarcus sp.]